MTRPIILSTLSPGHRWDAGLVPLESYRGLQALFGWDAQLKSMGAYLQRFNARRFVAAAPELFFTRTSLATVAPQAGLGADDMAAAVHIRVGSARHTRLLRTIPNLLATADGTWPEILAPGRHPFRHHNIAPHAVAGVIDLARAAPLIRPNGSKIPSRPAPTGLIAADFPRLTAPPKDALEPADFRGLELHSLVEFRPEYWIGDQPARQPASLRRLAIEYNAQPASPRPLILLPWNLSNPAATAPDLAVAYLQAAANTGDAGAVLLLPFNATGPITQQLSPHLEQLQRRLAMLASGREGFSSFDPAHLNLFIARVVDLQAVNLLRRLRAVAWIDGQDPEAGYTAARLNACQIPAITLQPEGHSCRADELAVINDAGTIEVRNEFGQLFFRTGRVAWRNIEQVILATRNASAQTLPVKAAAKINPKQDEEFLDLLQAAV